MAQQLSSRLNRLLTLLDTGSTQATRLTAARQIGDIAKSHPQDLSSLLRQCHKYTTKSKGVGVPVKQPIESYLIKYRGRSSLSVTDFLHVLWCEKQMELRLHYGSRNVTDAMKRGIAIHATIDKEVDDGPQKAAKWAEEIFTYIQNIATLMDMTLINVEDVEPYVFSNELNSFSELKLLGYVEGQWITGKLDLVEMTQTSFGVKPQVKEYKSTKGGNPSYGAVREGQEYQLMLYKLIWDSLVKGEFQVVDFMDHIGLPQGLVLPEKLRDEIAEFGFHVASVEQVVSKYLDIFKYVPSMSEQMYLRYLDQDQPQDTLNTYIEEEVSYNHEVVMSKLRRGISFWRRELEPEYTNQRFKCRSTLCSYPECPRHSNHSDHLMKKIADSVPEFEDDGMENPDSIPKHRPTLVNSLKERRKENADRMRRLMDDLQKKLDESFLNMQLCEKALERFEDDQSTSVVVLHRHLLRTTAATIADTLLHGLDILKKLKNGTEVGDSKTQDPVLLDSSERTALAKNLNGSFSKKALALVEALEGKRVDTFMTTFRDLAEESGLVLKKLDKNLERTLLRAYREDLISQVSSESHPVALLAKVVSLLYIKIHNKALQAPPGRAIAAAISHLKDKLDETAYNTLTDYQTATVTLLALMSASSGEEHDCSSDRILTKRKFLEGQMPILRTLVLGD